MEVTPTVSAWLAFWDGDGDGAAEWTALFTGDAEAEQLGQLSDRRQPAVWTC